MPKKGGTVQARLHHPPHGHARLSEKYFPTGFELRYRRCCLFCRLLRACKGIEGVRSSLRANAWQCQALEVEVGCIAMVTHIVFQCSSMTCVCSYHDATLLESYAQYASQDLNMAYSRSFRDVL